MVYDTPLAYLSAPYLVPTCPSHSICPPEPRTYLPPSRPPTPHTLSAPPHLTPHRPPHPSPSGPQAFSTKCTALNLEVSTRVMGGKEGCMEVQAAEPQVARGCD